MLYLVNVTGRNAAFAMTVIVAMIVVGVAQRVGGVASGGIGEIMSNLVIKPQTEFTGFSPKCSYCDQIKHDLHLAYCTLCKDSFIKCSGYYKIDFQQVGNGHTRDVTLICKECGRKAKKNKDEQSK